ncbi:MAG: hypothetical protein ACK5V3_03935 [Bdellovibrionales bacterium]
MKNSILILLLFVQTLFAQTENKTQINSTTSASELSGDEVLKSFDYPELQVVPRATERLQTEADNERTDKIQDYWSTLVPSGLTLINGAQLMNSKRADLNMQDREDADWAARTGVIIGAGGLAFSYHLLRRDKAQMALSETKKNQATGRRGQLYRERIAEEYLADQASFDRKLIWTGAFLNLASNAWMMDYASDDNKALVGLGALSSFLPLIFQQRSIKNYHHHQRAKSRIYVPLSGIILVPSQQGPVAVNSLQWSWTY